MSAAIITKFQDPAMQELKRLEETSQNDIDNNQIIEYKLKPEDIDPEIAEFIASLEGVEESISDFSKEAIESLRRSLTQTGTIDRGSF